MAQIAQAYALTNQIESADIFFDKAVKLQSEKLGDTHYRTVETKLNLVRHLLAQKRFTQAEKILAKLWKQLPTAADRNLFPLELQNRKKVIQFHVDLYEALGKPEQKKVWSEKK
jgi:tetratricopeptide (TPR) repeat protein